MNGEDEKFRSRKWMVTNRAAATGAGLVLVAMALVAGLIALDKVPGAAGAEVLSSMLFTAVGFLTFIAGLYHGANVWQKRVDARALTADWTQPADVER